jgi:hypothetical protein
MIVKPKLHGGNQLNPALNTNYKVISKPGPGVFVTGRFIKQGGNNDITNVSIHIDGNVVFASTYLGADNIGLDVDNNSGVKLVKGSLDVFTVQFNEPLYFGQLFEVIFNAGNDAGVVNVSAQVLLAESCKYPV